MFLSHTQCIQKQILLRSWTNKYLLRTVDTPRNLSNRKKIQEGNQCMSHLLVVRSFQLDKIRTCNSTRFHHSFSFLWHTFYKYCWTVSMFYPLGKLHNFLCHRWRTCFPDSQRSYLDPLPIERYQVPVKSRKTVRIDGSGHGIQHERENNVCLYEYNSQRKCLKE